MSECERAQMKKAAAAAASNQEAEPGEQPTKSSACHIAICLKCIVCDCLTLSRNVNPLRFHRVSLGYVHARVCVSVCVSVCVFVHHQNDSIKLEFELCLSIIPFGFSCCLGTLLNFRSQWTLGPPR